MSVPAAVTVAPTKELRFAETCEPGNRCSRALPNAAGREDPLLVDELVRQRRLTTPAKDDALVVLSAGVREEVDLELIEPRVEQHAHRSGSEDLVHRANQDEDAGRHEKVDRHAEKRDLFATTAAELVIERGIEIDEREGMTRDARRLEAAWSEDLDLRMRRRAARCAE